MSESERLPEGTLLPDGRKLPADCDEQEADLLLLLNDLFDVEGEDLPPRYAQTLLGDQFYSPADQDFEDRVADSVFRRLSLPRSLVPSVRRPVFHTQIQRLQRAKRLFGQIGKQSVLAALSVFLLLSFSAASSGAALASMLQTIVGRGGTQGVVTLPKNLSDAPTTTATQTIPDHRINFKEQWPAKTIAGYTFAGMDVFDSRWWTDGGMVTFRYRMVDAQGTHQLTILEFMPKEHVALQVVKDGSTSSVPIGAANGIFVNGRWVYHNGAAVWEPNQRAELILGSVGEPGLVIWIAADNLSGGNMDQAKQLLVNVASALKPFSLADLTDSSSNLQYLGNRLLNDINQPFGGDVIALKSGDSDSDSSTVYIQLASDSQSHTQIVDPENRR